MKHFLADNVCCHYDGDLLKVSNQNGNVVEFKDVSARLFEKIVKGEEDYNCIDFLMQNGVKSRLEARRLFNSMIYTLSSLRMLSSDRSINFEGEKINIASTMIEITNGCNFRCPHCYVDKAKTKALTFAKVKNIIDELYCLNASKILFTGGEVLTHKDFMKMYYYAYKKGFIITINSNGSLVTDDIIEKLVKYPPHAIEISVYGYNEETYQHFVNRKNQHDIVIKNIEKLKKAHINVVCKCVLTNSNIEFFDKIKEKCEKIGVKFYSDYLTFPQINGEFKQNNEQVSPKEAVELLKKNEFANDYYLKLYSAKTKTISDSVFQCRLRDDTIFINCQSQVNLCPCMQSISYAYKKGNLAQCILKLKEILKIKFKKDAKCKNCSLMSICRYCPAKFYLATGDYQNPPSWYCDFAHLVYKNFIEGIRSRQTKYLNEFEKETIKKLGCKKINARKNEPENNFVLIYKNGDICGFAQKDKNSNIISSYYSQISEQDFNKIIKKHTL